MTIPRVLARSVISRAKLASTMRAEVEAVDILFSDNGPFGPDRKFPHWKFADLGSSIPNASSDVLELGIPVLYGEESDAGATDPSTSDPASKGMLPGFFLGKFAIGDAVPSPWQYRAVGGGGGAGSGLIAGGGGGGSVIDGTVAMAVGSWAITVGAAGAADTNGTASTINSDTAPGGGHGGQQANPGASGGNGGGAGGAAGAEPADEESRGRAGHHAFHPWQKRDATHRRGQPTAGCSPPMRDGLRRGDRPAATRPGRRRAPAARPAGRVRP